MSFIAYSTYNDSGVDWIGRVPVGWHVGRLKQTCKLITEKADTRLRPIALENIESWSGRLIETSTEFEGEGVAFREGDVLFGKLRPYLAKVHVAMESGEAVGDFHVLRPNDALLARFVFYQIARSEVIAVIDGSTFGARMPRVSWEFMANLSLAVPPINEQHAICSFLDRETGKIDALVEEQTRLIELLKEKRQAVISHAVTKGLNPDAPMKDSGVEWLGAVPAHWDVVPLKRAWTVTDCKHITAEFVADGMPLASIREAQSRFVDLTEAKQTTEGFYAQLIEGGRRPQIGDLIFTRNATVGEVAQVAEWHPPFAMGQDVCLLRKNAPSLSTDYLWHVLRSEPTGHQLANLMIGSTFKRVNVEEIRSLMIPMPPPIEQHEIAVALDRQIDSASELILAAETGITLLQERRSALISAAVTGKIDVRGLLSAEAEAA